MDRMKKVKSYRNLKRLKLTILLFKQDKERNFLRLEQNFLMNSMLPIKQKQDRSLLHYSRFYLYSTYTFPIA
jgi:hypothetical protein